MTIRYILAAAATASLLAASAALPMRTSAVGELAPYCFPDNRPASAADIKFMPDGKSYTQRSDDGKMIIVRDIASGKPTDTIFNLDRTRETVIADFDDYILSPDASRLIVSRNSAPIYRRSSTAEHYVYEVRSRLLRPLSRSHSRTSEPLFSPDSRMVAFVAQGNIYAAKLDYQTEVAVTADGAPGKIINGATDWTYEEEFTVTSLMAWAPDNLNLCYVKFDESRVPLYSLPIYEGTCSRDERYALYPGALSYKYPVAGEPNSTVTLHSYDVETRKTKEMTFPGGDPYYIPRIAYGPTADMLMVATLNRDQNRFELFRVNPKSTVAKSIYVQESKAWIEPSVYEAISFDDKGFTVSEDGSGYTRYVCYSYAGAPTATIAMDSHDVTAYYGTDDKGNHYFQAAAPTPMQRTVYRLDRKGTVTPVGSTEGTSSAVFAPGCAAALMTHSDIHTPPVTSLCRNDGKVIRTVEDNKSYADRTRGLLADKEFITVPGADGTQLNAYIIKPRNFNASQRYPVIMSQYSGPGSQQVLNRWSIDWEHYFASKGYIVLCVDGRGTGGRGTQFRTAVYRRLGILETADQCAAARYAATLPYVDASKIGIYGWSFGGYEALMCAGADNTPFAAATAVAPVSDWRYYDTVYTERYMLTPQQNESGYTESSAIGRALRLGCPLLIMYGTADDNVHPANSLQYVSALQSAGIMCDMFVFPNMNHSINGCNARSVVYARMFQFFNDKLR